LALDYETVLGKRRSTNSPKWRGLYDVCMFFGNSCILLSLGKPLISPSEALIIINPQTFWWGYWGTPMFWQRQHCQVLKNNYTN